MQFANLQVSKIIEVKNDIENDSIVIYLDGPLLDGDQVGWPNLINVIEPPSKVIPIKIINYTEIDFKK